MMFDSLDDYLLENQEYEPQIEAQRITVAWKAAIQPQGRQYNLEDLPLFRVDRQMEMFPARGSDAQ